MKPYASKLSRSEAGPPRRGEQPSPGNTSKPRSAFATMLNSAAGLSILTFLLTGVLSAIISFLIGSMNEDRRQSEQALRERSESLARLRGVVSIALTRTAALIDTISYDVTRDDGEADLRSIWPEYRKTFLDGQQTILASQGDIEQEASRRSDGTIDTTLSSYLVSYVAPKLASQNECVVEAHDSYLDERLDPKERHDEAAKELKKCQDPSWDVLKICIQDVALNLNNAISARRRALDDGRGFLQWLKSLLSGSRGGFQRDAEREQERLFALAGKYLEKSCGPRPLQFPGPG